MHEIANKTARINNKVSQIDPNGDFDTQSIK